MFGPPGPWSRDALRAEGCQRMFEDENTGGAAIPDPCQPGIDCPKQRRALASGQDLARPYAIRAARSRSDQQRGRMETRSSRTVRKMRASSFTTSPMNPAPSGFARRIAGAAPLGRWPAPGRIEHQCRGRDGCERGNPSQSHAGAAELRLRRARSRRRVRRAGVMSYRCPTGGFAMR